VSDLEPDRLFTLSAPPLTGGGAGRVNLRTLVGLRWMAILGQLTAVLVVAHGFGFDLPLVACLAVIALSAGANLTLMAANPLQRVVPQPEAAAHIAFDTIQLSLLLYFTGGIENPFSLMLIAASSAAASILRLRWTLLIVLITVFCLIILSVWAWPLPWSPAGSLNLPPLYQVGMFAAILIGVLFNSASSWRLAEGENRMGNALLATQAVLAREQKLAALGGLATAAAHELGTPLATIQVTAKELARALPDGQDREDAQLILSQAERCRVILRNLSAGSSTDDPQMTHAPFAQLLEDAVARHREEAPGKAVLFDILGGPEGDELVVPRSPEITYGVGNFVENALDFATSKVVVQAEWTAQRVRLKVYDDGPGFDDDILPRLGEPYVTTRGRESQNAELHEGLGLGFFIAKTLIERSGGEVVFRNRVLPERGAEVRVEWSRQRLENPG
jgi:two-component system, sensor histidine kinase RegB